MFCAQCGNKMLDGVRFCATCGYPVEVPNPLSPDPPALVRPQAVAPPPSPAGPPRQSYTPPVAPPQTFYAPPPPAPTQLSYAPPPPVAQPQPQPGYGYSQTPGQPASAASGYPGFAAQIPVSAAGGPIPPDMHWAVVLILSGVTFGLCGLVWSFKEAFFVKKIDPSSKSVTMLMIACIAMIVQVAISFMAGRSGSIATMASASTIVLLLNLVFIVVLLIAVFGMRRSLVLYYNSVENIGLKLSGVMTFFFSILYFQCHFSRIAEMKKRGS